MDKTNIRAFFDNVLATSKASPELRERIEKEIVFMESGHYVYWPTQNRGYLDEYHLVLIAAMLNKKNRDLDDDIDAFFSKQADTKG